MCKIAGLLEIVCRQDIILPTIAILPDPTCQNACYSNTCLWYKMTSLSDDVNMSETYNSDKGKSTIFIIVLLLLNSGVIHSLRRHKRAARISCEESVKTVGRVSTCATDKQAWDERVRLKACWDVPHNCSDTQLSYHCLLNEFGHGLVEVCAISTEIIGRRCAEFTPGGMFVQEHFEKSCRSCPFAYNSSMSYLYDECFDFAESKFTSDGHTNQQTSGKGSIGVTHSHQKYNSQSTEPTAVPMRFVTAVAIVLGIIVPVMSVCILQRYYRCIQRLGAEENMTLKIMNSKQSEATPDFTDASSNKAIDGTSTLKSNGNPAETPLLHWKIIEKT
ncbi:uncharacterized protein LOC125673478 isoform X2 [Ostrea edulis]|uniref:uncharacterized protein LOC125673478 isoform X2 n=1 Tax=Ostrea edulis TaxID=37623 RepID=UPI0024AFB2B4|nr:uncharacterized protein LOC125673478 isoform X2 [Ostrea edulis]